MSNDRVMTDPSEKVRALAEKATPDSVMGMDEDESGGHCAACVIEGQTKHCNQPAAFLALRSAVPDLLDRLALLEGIVRDLAAASPRDWEWYKCIFCKAQYEPHYPNGEDEEAVYSAPHGEECVWRRAVAAIAIDGACGNGMLVVPKL